MSHASCEKIAHFIEANMDAILEACSAQTTPAHSGLLRELVVDWLSNLVASLQGEPYRAGEWAAYFAATAKSMELSVSEALALLDTLRFSLTSACAEENPTQAEAHMRVCIFEASEIFKNHLVEYYLQETSEAVAAGTRKQKAALEASANPMVVLDEQGVIELTNRELGRLLNTNADVLVGQDFYEFCSSDTVTQLRATQRKKRFFVDLSEEGRHRYPS
jgi:PAS domain-containing protein